MKHFNFLFFSSLLSVNTFSQSAKMFDELYFINSLTDLMSNNVDSVKIYSLGDSAKDKSTLFCTYIIQSKEDVTVVERKTLVFSPILEIDINSSQVFYLNKNFVIDSIRTYGIQDAIFLANTIDKKIIEYEKDYIKSITVIGNNFSDTTVKNFHYLEKLVYKVNIEERSSRRKQSTTTNEVIYIEYYRKGEILKMIKE